MEWCIVERDSGSSPEMITASAASSAFFFASGPTRSPDSHSFSKEAHVPTKKSRGSRNFHAFSSLLACRVCSHPCQAGKPDLL